MKIIVQLGMTEEEMFVVSLEWAKAFLKIVDNCFNVMWEHIEEVDDCIGDISDRVNVIVRTTMTTV